MKQKKKYTPYLIIGVVLIWGFVIYKIVAILYPDDSKPIKNTSTIKPENQEEEEKTLSLNYEDPFFPRSKRKSRFTTESSNSFSSSNNSYTYQSSGRKKKKTHKNNSKSTITKRPILIYKGFVRKTSSQKPLAIVNINKSSVFVHTGDSLQGVKIEKLSTDTLYVSSGDNIFKYPRQ